jgi:hypothetical protein
MTQADDRSGPGWARAREVAAALDPLLSTGAWRPTSAMVEVVWVATWTRSTGLFTVIVCDDGAVEMGAMCGPSAVDVEVAYGADDRDAVPALLAELRARDAFPPPDEEDHSGR